MGKDAPEARGYRWGKFHGYAMAVAYLFPASQAFNVFSTRSEWGNAPEAFALAVIRLLIGIGIARKNRIALVAYFIQSGIFVVVAILNPVSLILSTVWIIPAIFYYPKRWKEFTKYGNVPAPPNAPEQPSQQTTWLPDFGKHLANTGTPQNTMFVYPTLEMSGLQIVGLGRYCVTLVQPYEGKSYCATFDFDDDVLCEILKAATPRTLDVVTASLIEDPESTRNLRLPDSINVGVSAVLGEVQQGLNEMFVPLVIKEVFGTEPYEPKD